MGKKHKAAPCMIYAKLLVKPPVMQGGQPQIFCEFSGNEDETKIMREMFSTYHGTPFCFFAEQNFIPVSDSLFCRYPVPPWEWAGKNLAKEIQLMPLSPGQEAHLKADHGA